MSEGPLRHLFWRLVDYLDYLVTLARLRILGALASPLPETPADRQRDRDRNGYRGRSPRSNRKEAWCRGPP